MAIKNDLESILDGVKLTLQSNLAAKLTEIETDKADSITLPITDNDAYFLQTLDDRAANYDPVIVYGIENIEPQESQYGDTAEKLSIYIVFLLAETNDANMTKILFRYQRAFKEIFEENFTDHNIGNKMLIRSLEPVPFVALDSSSKYKAIGIIIETVLA